jgi:hypothetical protein
MDTEFCIEVIEDQEQTWRNRVDRVIRMSNRKLLLPAFGAGERGVRKQLDTFRTAARAASEEAAFELLANLLGGSRTALVEWDGSLTAFTSLALPASATPKGDSLQRQEVAVNALSRCADAPSLSTHPPRRSSWRITFVPICLQAQALVR